MSKTRDDVRRRVLMDLRVVESGQPVAQEDMDSIDVVASLETLASLREADLVAQAVSDQIGDEWLIPLGLYIAGEHATMFGFSDVEAENMRSRGLDRIRLIADRAKPLKSLNLDVARLR